MCMLCTMAGKSMANHMSVQEEYEFAKRVLEAQGVGQTIVEYMRGKPRWISLHGHSEFSLLDGGAKIGDIIRKAKRMGQDAIAITDHGNMFGAVKAHKIAKEEGIKHIVGCEFYLTPVGKSRFEKDFKKGEKAYHHLVTLAKNKTGYQNLAKLSSMGYSDGFYRNPRIDREVLEAHKEGLIITTSCVGGSVPMNAMDGDFYKSEKDMEWFAKTFGEDFYVELQDHDTDFENQAFTYMREMAQKYDIKSVITTDAHYLDREDQTTHDALLCIGTGQWVDQPQRTFRFDGSGFHYMDEVEVKQRFPHDLDAILEAGKIADKIDDQVITFGEVQLPDFQVPTGDDEFDQWAIGKGYAKWTLADKTNI